MLTPREEVAAPAALLLEGPPEEARRNRARLCAESGLSDVKFYDLNKTARKQTDANGVNRGWRSHTERYRADPAYRQHMEQNGTPEWLMLKTTGFTSKFDGTQGDEWPRRY